MFGIKKKVPVQQGPTRKDYEEGRYKKQGESTGQAHGPTRKDMEEGRYKQQGESTGQVHGPTRQDLQQQNPTPTDTGVQHGPDRYDFSRKKKIENIDSNRQKVEDQQSTQYWRTQKKEHDAAERKKELALEKSEKDRKNKPRVRRGKPGVEMPTAGLHRFGYASRGLSPNMIGADSGGAEGYSDAFSMGVEMSGMAAARGQRSAGREMSVDFGRMSVGTGGNGRGSGGYMDPLSGLRQGIGGSGSPKAPRKVPREGVTGVGPMGIRQYQDPFGGMRTGPRAPKVGKSKKASKGRSSGSSLFNLRLF